MPDSTKKILIYSANWVGDAVFSLPAVNSIRQAFPEARISILAKPWASDVFKGNPDIHELILLEDRFNSLTGKLKLAKILKSKSFDMVFLLPNSFGSALTAWIAGIPERIGYRRGYRGLLLTEAIPSSKKVDEEVHPVSYYLNLLKEAGIPANNTLPWIHLTLKERLKARQTFEGIKRPVIGITAGAYGSEARRWPIERFAEVARRIVKDIDGSVIIFGWKSEMDIANKIIKSFDPADAKSRVISLVGKTTLRELAALISECNVLLTNDSGPLHLGQAVGAPIVSLFGPVDPALRLFSKGAIAINKSMDCSPCFEKNCKRQQLDCMLAISADEVLEAVKQQIAINRAVFLDKDGTIIEDKNYLNKFDDLVIFRGTKEELKKLKDLGFKLIGITNQSGIERGLIDENFIKESNEYLQKELGIDDFYYCPHHPDRHCSCRKPEPSLLYSARTDHSINLKTSYVIGDRESDVLLAGNVGAIGILLSLTTPEKTSASYVAKNLNGAVDWILKREKIHS